MPLGHGGRGEVARSQAALLCHARTMEPTRARQIFFNHRATNIFRATSHTRSVLKLFCGLNYFWSFLIFSLSKNIFEMWKYLYWTTLKKCWCPHRRAVQCCQLTACCCAELVCCHGSSQSQRRIRGCSPPIGWQSSPVSRDWNAAFLSFRFARQSLVLKVNLLSVSILDWTLPAEQITDEKMSWNCQVIITPHHNNETAIQYILFPSLLITVHVAA